MAFRIERYANTRFWALYDGDELVVVTVYKRGAQEVQRRLAAQPRRQRAAAAQAAAVEAAAQQVRELAAQARALARQAQAAARTRSASQGGTPLVPPPPPRRSLGCGRGRCLPAPPPFSPRSPSVPTLSLGN